MGNPVLRRAGRRLTLAEVLSGGDLPVLHCLVQCRSDSLGANHNAKLFAIGRAGVAIEPGSPGRSY